MSETERLTDSVKELLGGGRDERLAGLLENAHAADISSVLRELPLPDQVRLFRLLSSQHAGEVLSELDDPTQRELLRALDEQEVSRVLDQMPADDVVEVVEELPKEEAEKILDLMAEEKSEEVQELLEYREGTAGRLMSPNVVAVHEAATVAQAIEHIRKSKSGDDAFYVYVVDDHDHLVGFVPLHRLLTADPRTPIHAIRNADVESVAVDTDQEEVARLVERYDLVQVPVVDASRRLLGAIGVDDVIDIIHEEATEDIQRLGGVAGDETVLDPPEAVFTKRLVWRLINLVVRGIALGEVSRAVLGRVLWKELWLGLTTGAANGLVIAAIAYLWKGQILLSLILGVALLFNMLVAAVVGTLVPIALKAFRIDPAIASSVIITTFTDVFGFFSFLGLATVLIRFLL